MPAELRITKGKQSGKSFALRRRGSYSVGRRSRNAITIRHRSVSREHCRVDFDGENYWVVDQESHNGTYVNGRRVRRVLLYDGDIITLGKVDLEFCAPNRRR